MGCWKRRLSDDERSVLLSELLLRHPELAAEAEKITSALLVVNDRELTGEITTRLRTLRPRGPVSVDAGRERILEVLQPYIDDLTRRKERGARRAAADVSLGFIVVTGDIDCRDVILDGPHLEICFQKVKLEPHSKTPVHFDIVSEDWLAEIRRLTGLGATVKERFEAHAWMRDPEGNDFCVIDGNHGHSAAN